MTLDEVQADHPAWECFPSVTGHLFYARRPRSSPPIVIRNASPDGLWCQLTYWEAQRSAYVPNRKGSTDG